MIGVRQLDGVPLFAALAREARAELASAAVEATFARGEFLWLAGEQARGLFVVLSGHVRILGSRAGRQYVIHTGAPGDTLGEVPLFGGAGYPASATASQATRCLVVGAGPLRAAMAADPTLAWTLLENLAVRVRELVERLEGLTARTVRSRLAAHLLALASAGDDATVEVVGTQEQLAEDLGTVREVVARELARLRREGVVASAGRGRLTVIDEEALERVALA